MGHSKFKFKSSGKKFNDRKFSNESRSKIQSIGIKTPVSNTGTTEIFDMHTDPRAQIKDNLRNLILTNQGERICRHDFGANLKSILYDYSKDMQYLNTVKKFIVSSVEKNMPMVSITDISAVVLNDLEKYNANILGLAKLKLKIIFAIPKIRAENLALEVEMFIGG